MAKFLAWLVPAALLGTLLSHPSTARADFARAPESPYHAAPPYQSDSRDDARGHYVDESWGRREQPSTVRLHVGPSLLVQPATPGLFTALDVGHGAVGGRVSAMWLRPQSEAGLAAYNAELWIDFRHRFQLHPVLGAGASYLRGGAIEGSSGAGAGVLRGSLEYELPVADADARLGVCVLLLVPAIAADRTRPWSMAAVTVAAGF